MYWEKVPAFPHYEVTLTGDIRTVDTQTPVEVYMGRTKIGEDLHPRVRLANVVGYKTTHALRDIVRDTFGIEEAKRHPKVTPTKPKFARSRKEFRRIPEFQKYEIAEDGEVRNWWSKKPIAYRQNSHTGAWAYSLRTDTGGQTQRSKESLLRNAYPENFPPPTERQVIHQTRTYARRGSYVEIPGYPKYQIHPDGKVRYSKTRRPRPTEWNGAIEYVILFNDGGSVKRKIKDLIKEIFPEMEEAA
ncbi:HNH endonuclease [Arthrobacter phage MediumFry]|nr:HNH endonuclease [Arthrobacter phage MediumFry]